MNGLLLRHVPVSHENISGNLPQRETYCHFSNRFIARRCGDNIRICRPILFERNIYIPSRQPRTYGSAQSIEAFLSRLKGDLVGSERFYGILFSIFRIGDITVSGYNKLSGVSASKNRKNKRSDNRLHDISNLVQ